TKLGSLVFESKEERQAENLRKMFLAISKDIRVLIIKLADRLHNLRTINYMSERQILDKCRETLEIYAPLASRLGMYQIKFELEDIALRNLEPEAFEQISQAVRERKAERESDIERIIERIREVVDEYQIHCEIKGRTKHIYSIYTKMKEQNKPFDEIFDLTAVRILVDTVKDCYAVLGMVHTLWRPMPGRFKDYIAMPKPNMYQSLHTTLIGDDGGPFEVQIRTWSMHHVAEFGIAAHWKYKEGIGQDQEELKLAWIRQTLEFNQDSEDPREFMEMMRTDLFSDQVFVFTPKGDVMELPAGSTPIDFAFKIHTGVGAKTVGARVNGKMVPINYVLQNGEVIDIVTSNSSKGPSMDWLAIAKSNHARQKIRQWLKKQDPTQNVDRGREVLEKAVRRKGYDPQDLMRTQWIAKLAKSMGYGNSVEFYAALSSGGALVGKAIAKLAEIYQEEYDRKVREEATEPEQSSDARQRAQRRPPNQNAESRIIVEGMTGMMTRLAKCCSPVPGDRIIGFITKGRGVTVHRDDCPNIRSLSMGDTGRLIHVEWDTSRNFGTFNAELSILAEDRKGLFSDISRACLDMDLNIWGVNSKITSDNLSHITMTLSIKSIDEMEKILRTLRQIPNVIEVYRTHG
ncbi:MAG: bifunctional (p)ppGpp synthetase/guanosine-3',5'-bis(diphosphate) 3'-pyrophosphohydrolase, partial [Clostridiales bacterium]|nr:bifunctional (p)ppGpp synthetase/guanosine-3',5'-bis(diphosphate) 3'-pyrophosphohydrolase [Clostridiales bacterium]